VQLRASGWCGHPDGPGRAWRPGASGTHPHGPTGSPGRNRLWG